MAPTEVEEQVPNLRNKARYVLHYWNLQLYTSLSGHASDQSPSRPPVRPKPLNGAIHPDEYRAPEEGSQRL